MLLFCAPTFAKLRPCGASKFFLPPAGFGSTHKIERCPQLCDTWRIFLWSPGAAGSKNNCDFAGFDLNGDLHNKSSHAPVKNAIIILLSFRFPTCITSQVVLSGKSWKLFLFYFQRTACIICKPRCLLRTGFPRSAVPLIDLPVCRASMRCFPAGA